MFSTFYKFSRNWSDVMLMMRLRGEQLYSLIGRRVGEEHLDEALARGQRGDPDLAPSGQLGAGGLGLAEMGTRSMSSPSGSRMRR